MRDGPRNRSNRGRIMRWNEDKDQLLILALDNICKKNSFGIPWNDVAALVDPRATGGAVEQHIAKLRKRRLDQGQNVPPLARLQRGSQINLATNSSRIKASSSAFNNRKSARAKLKTALFHYVDHETLSDDEDAHETDDDWGDCKESHRRAARKRRVALSSRTSTSPDELRGKVKDRGFFARRAKCIQHTEAAHESSHDDDNKFAAPCYSLLNQGTWQPHCEGQELAEANDEVTDSEGNRSNGNGTPVQKFEAGSLIVKFPVKVEVLESLYQGVATTALNQEPNGIANFCFPESDEYMKDFKERSTYVQQIKSENVQVSEHPEAQLRCREPTLVNDTCCANDNDDFCEPSPNVEPANMRFWPPHIPYHSQDASMLSSYNTRRENDTNWCPGYLGPITGSAGVIPFCPSEGIVQPIVPILPGGRLCQSYDYGYVRNFGINDNNQEHDNDMWQLLASPYR